MRGRIGYASFSRRITQYQLPPPMRGKWRAQRADGGAHAARGYSLSPPPPLRGPPPPLTQGRLFVYGMPISLPDARDAGCCIVPSQCEGLRYFSFPHRYGGSGERSEPIGAPMPHAALWVVQPKVLPDLQGGRKVSMPHVAIPFRPHHRFAVPLPRSRRGGFSVTACRLLSPTRRTWLLQSPVAA